MKKAKQFIVGLLVSITACLSASVFSACKEETTDGTGEAGNQTEQGGGNTETETENKYKNYSEILQNVLTGELYENLIFAENSYPDSTYPYSYNNPRFMPIPYKFLEDEGFDIIKIKKGELYSKSNIYTINNDLYVELRAEIKTEEKFWKENSSYCANYLIKYTLTDQELKELNSLFVPVSYSSKATYMQAPFFIQELSYHKEPEILSLQYITLESISAVEEYCNQKHFVLNTNILTYLGTNHLEDVFYEKMFQTHVDKDSNTSSIEPIKFKTYLYTLYFKSIGPGYLQVNDENVYISTKPTALQFTDEYKEKTLKTKTAITLYSVGNCRFKNILKESSLEDIIAK